MKEIQRDHFTEDEIRGIESAIESMDDVSQFVNSYMSDSEYIKNTERIFERMTGLERLQMQQGGGPLQDFMFQGGHMVMSAKGRYIHDVRKMFGFSLPPLSLSAFGTDMHAA